MYMHVYIHIYIYITYLLSSNWLLHFPLVTIIRGKKRVLLNLVQEWLLGCF